MDDTIRDLPNNAWLVGGDFNKILKFSEKFGGNGINHCRARLFLDCINYCRLIDLGFKGSKFTWSNKRYRNKKTLFWRD